jgi:uncharacterized protein (DUF58 family)
LNASWSRSPFHGSREVLTRLGWIAVATSVVLIGLGLTLYWPAALTIGIAVALICLVALSYLLRPPDLRVDRRIAPDRVPKGELAIAHLRVRNRSRRTFPGEMGVQLVGDREVEVELPRLRRGETELRTGVLPTDRRGLHPVGQVYLRRTDPFRLVVAERRYAKPSELLVLPKVLGFRALRNTLTRSVDGSTDDTNPHGSMVFHQLREYVPGDDIRRIHWPSTAKLAYSGDLIVRQDVDEAQPYVVVLVDLRPQGYSEDSFELALDAAASAVVAAATGRAPFELRTTGGAVVGGPNNQATAPAMEALAMAQPTPQGSLTAELATIRRSRGGAALIVVTGMLDPGELPAVAALRLKFQRTFLVSVTPEPRPPQLHPGLTVIQGSDEEQLAAAWNVAVR